MKNEVNRAPNIGAKKHKFSSFLTHKGRWFLATLTLLFTLSIGQMWGAASTISDDATASGTITFSEVGTISAQNTYWYNGLKFYEQSTNEMSTDNGKRWSSKITPPKYGTFTSGSNWQAGSYEMTGLIMQAHCLAINVSSACTIEIVVNMSGKTLGQSNPVVPGNLKVFWDGTAYNTAYTSSNYKTGTAKTDTTWAQNINGKYNRMKLSIPVSASDLATKDIDVIKVSYTGSATGTPGYSCAFVYESVKIVTTTAHTVTYKANGGTGSNVVDDEATTVAANTFTAPSGKVFAGWNTQADGEGTAYAVGANVSSDLELYAKWVDGYTVSFNLQDHGSAIASVDVAAGGKVTKPTNPTAEGYVFRGWYKEAGCTNAWDFDNDVVNATTTLYAKWLALGLPLAAFPSGDTDLGTTEWTTTTKNVAIYEDNNRMMMFSQGNALTVNAHNLQIGNSSKASAFVFYVGEESDVDVTVSRYSNAITVTLYYMGATTDVLTSGNLATEGTLCDQVVIGGEDSDDHTLSKANAAAGYYKVYSTLHFIAKNIEITAVAPSCAATIPGNITKGTATGGTGTITLTAGGDIASGDAWYWQSAADGTATNLGNGKTKDVSAAGTYYVRSYNTAGDCWSTAKSVTVEAADLLTAITPSLSYGANVIVGNTLSPTLTGNTGSGAVTYALNDVTPAGSLTINESTGVVTAVTAGGTATVTATIAANGYYAGNTATSGTITAVANPLGSHTLTWAMKVGSSSYSTLLDEASSTSTCVTAGSTLNLGTNTTIDAGNNGASDRTIKVFGAGTGTERDDDSYVEFPFTIASGYIFTPTAVSAKVANVSTAKSYDLVLLNADGSSTKERTTFASTKTDGNVETISWSEITGLSLTGSGKLRVYAFNKGATDGFRFGTPITITGTVTATTPAAPEFTEPATEPAAATYYIGKTITALSVAATGYPVPTLQWYSNDSKSTTGATPIDGATSATYTPSNAAASDLYYYCVATNASGTDRSEYFHVTVVPAPTIEDLVTISDDYTKTFTETITEGSIYDSNRFLNCGGAENNYSSGKGIRIKENRALAFKVADNAKVKATFEQNGDRKMQLGTSRTGDNKTAYGNSASSPVTFDVVSTGGVIYLTASSDLNLSKIEIFYPHTVTYALNGGTGTLPTQASKYAGEKFTVHNGETGISAPATKEFDKWKDQDNADVAGGAEYTMPAKAVTLTAQWRAETVKYTVTYDLADYTAGVAPTETNKAEGDVFAIKAAPERENYDFLGWLCDIDAATYQATNNYTMTAANTTFTAQWQEFFTITYKDGSTTLDTEKVNAGDAPAGIANPTKELYSFVGWTLEGEDDLIDPTTLTATTTLFAKWAAFDGCAYLAPETSGAEPSANDAVLLKSSSFGGTAKVVGKNGSGSITYTENGLSFTGGGKDSIRVTLNNQMQVGTTISVRLVANGTNARGLKLSTLSGTEKATLGFGSGTQSGDVGTFSYTVTADDGLDGKKAFRLSRSNSIYLKYITVEDCAPQDFTVTYKDGSTTMGTESVFENAHPTATGIATRKNGYVFQGWSETNGGDLVDLDDITITADKILYAKYTERVCATSGSMFKFQMKTDLTNGNVFATAPNSIAATTANYLAELAGGEVTFSVTGGNNRLKFYDKKAIGFENGDGGRITINLDCPLAEGDEIRFINYAANNNSATLSDGTHTQTLNGNNSETVQTWSVPANWADAYELTLTRASNTARITYFEIYRRPALTGVTMDDMRLKIGKTGTPVLHLTPSDDALITSQAWEITASTATGTTINTSTGLITAGETPGELTVQVTLNGGKVASATVTIVPGYESVQPVSETTTWQWEGVLAANTSITAGDTVLANYYGGAQWEKIAGKQGEYAYRAESYDCYQGTYLYFKTTVPGILTIYARYASTCALNVNGSKVADLTNSYQTYYAAVPAGDVFITSTNAMRIKSMKFDTDMRSYAITDNVWNGYERTVDPQYYGTICLPKAGVMTGALLFRVSYMDYKEDNVTPYKVYYDQVANGTMEAGMPYIFLAEQSTIGVYYTGTATETAQDHNGLHGTLEDITSGMNAEGRYMIYYNQVLHSTHPDSQLPANRAYLQIEEIPGYGNPSYVAPAPKYRRISMGVNAPQIATGMDELNVTDAPRKIMIDGTMYILRGEKMYDATGRLVK